MSIVGSLPLVRDAIAGSRFVIVAEIEPSAEVGEPIRRTRPHVVVVGADVGSADALRIFDGARPARCLLLAASPGEAGLIAAIAAGAGGYLPASVSAESLARALSEVAADEFAAPRRLAGRAIHRLARATVREPFERAGARSGDLTAREMAIGHLVALGLKDREIADELMVSPRTVQTHVANLRRKLGARNRTEAAHRLQSR